MKSKNQPPMKQGSPDNFQTPPIALDCLVPFLNKDWTIWECACGKGNLVKGLAERGFTDVIGTDKEPGWDFLVDKPVQWDCIITNPPFSIKEKFIQRCFDLGTPFALLMPLTTLESEKRHKIFREHKIQLIIPNKRFNFETPSGKGSGSWFCTAWFCYGLNLPNQLNFVELNQCQHSITTKEQDFSNASNLKGQIDNLDENSSADIINKELYK